MKNGIYPHYYMVLLAFMVMAAGCKKEQQFIERAPDAYYSDRIKFVLQYNPSLYDLYYQSLQLAGMENTFLEEGPFTVFALTGQLTYSLDDAPQPFSANFLKKTFIRGIYRLKDIPPGTTKMLEGTDGYKYLIEAYTTKEGTVEYTVNGALVRFADAEAANGVIHTIDGDCDQRTITIYDEPDQLSPNFTRLPFAFFPNPYTAITGNVQSAFVEFSYALQRTGLDKMLKDSSKAVTVLVPPTLGGIDAINQMSTDSLSSILKYHIIPQRMYMYNIKSMYKGDGRGADTVAVKTLNGNELRFILFPGNRKPSDYSNEPLVIDAKNNVQTIMSNNPMAFYYDSPGGRGVVHGVSGMLLQDK